MSPEEALALLRLNPEEPLDDQFEFLFFELKQKIYRQLDQVLLYPKWFKELTRLDTVARALGFGFTEENELLFKKEKKLSDSNCHSILAQFNAQQQQKSRVAFSIYNGKSPLLLRELLEFWLAQQKDFFEFWAAADLPTIEILLSQHFDPQQLLGLLNDLQKDEIRSVQDLSEANTPLVLQQYIAWNKAVWTKLNNA